LKTTLKAGLAQRRLRIPIEETMVEVNKPMRAEKLTAVKGMNDVLAPESAAWEWLEAKVRGLMVAIRLPEYPNADCGTHSPFRARFG
jgi:hypothetical protein